MDSKLTLRIDDDVKEAAKTLAKERGASVSQMVEDYFRLLLASESNADVELSSRGRDESASDQEDENSLNELGPYTRRIAGALHSMDEDPDSVHGDTKEADRRVAAQAAAKKHGTD